MMEESYGVTPIAVRLVAFCAPSLPVKNHEYE